MIPCQLQVIFGLKNVGVLLRGSRKKRKIIPHWLQVVCHPKTCFQTGFPHQIQEICNAGAVIKEVNVGKKKRVTSGVPRMSSSRITPMDHTS